VAGIAQSAGLTINANDVLDTDRDLTLAATNANITLRNATSARSWATSFTDLTLALTGTGDFTLVDSDDLTLSAASSGANVNITTTNADLTLGANTAVGGTLSLTTTGTGNLILPAAGFIQSAALTVNANDLLDTDRDVTLAASSANITLRNAASSRNWATSFNDLILSLTGSGDFALTDSNALTLTSATTGGNASFTTTNADLILSSDPAVSGNLSLLTIGTGNVIIPVAGITQSAGLTINTNDLLDTDRNLTLAATDASINLRGATAAHTWASSFNTLNLALTGSADFALVDNNALTLTSVTTSGNASFTTTNADLTLSSNPAVSGNLSLITTGAGNVIIPQTGLGLPAGLTINANDLLDTDRDLSLAAGSANITLRNAASSRNWATSFNDLILALTGSGDFALTDTNALILTSATTGGNASFTTTNADLTLGSNPAVSGNLSLITTGTGDVIIPQTGLGLPAGLTINANDLLDTDRNLTLAASDASINLRNATAAHTIASSFDSLDLTLRGGGDFVLNDSDGLILLGVDSDGDTRFTTTNADLNLAALTSFGSNLNLATTGSGTIILPTAGVSISGALSIDAMDLMDTDRDISLAANSATINLRGATQARSWLTDFASLSLQLSGAGDFTLTDNNGLNLTSVTTDGSASFTASNNNLTLTTNPQVGGTLNLAATGSGAVIIPDAGLSSAGNLTINASDLRDTDTALVLAADNANINLRDAVAARSWTTDFNRLDLTLSGGGDISVTNNRALTLAAVTTTGAAAFTAINGDLILSTEPLVGGNLQLITTGSGNLVVPSGGLTQANALSINANDLLDTDRDISLAASSADITLRGANAARTWNTDFTNLTLMLTGSGDFVLTDANALTLTAVTTGANARFTATNADLTLSANPNVAGALSLLTSGAGRLIVPATGLNQAGALTINASDMLDTDHSLNLMATAADITLRNTNSAHSWATDFNQLNLALSGGSDLVLTDANGLTLNAITTDANASFITTNADLTLLSDPAVAGNLNLITSGAGNLVIPAGGINQAAALVINANDVLDTDFNISLAANTAQINLRDTSGARSWNTDFNHLALSLIGSADLTLTDANDLILDAASSGANLAITSQNADLTLAADTQVSGTLSLQTIGAGNLVIPVSGFSQAGALMINAHDLIDTDANLLLGATAATINLRSAQAARSWQTAFDSLSLSLTGGGDFSLLDQDGLTLAGITSSGNGAFTSSNADLILTQNPALGGSLTLSTTGAGNLIVPVSGINHAASLIINANDILDTDRDISLAAGNAQINLRAAQAARTWQSNFTDLALTLNGAGEFSLIDSDALTISALSSAGNVNLTSTQADLTLLANTSVSGSLNLTTTGNGRVIIPASGFSHSGALSINADDLLDNDSDISLTATAAVIRLRNALNSRTWQSDFVSLDLTLSNAGDFALTDANGLRLNAISSDGNTAITASLADLILVNNPAVSGNLNLTATGAGRIIIPSDGLNHAGALGLNASDIMDTDLDIALQAAAADIALRAASGARTWTTQLADVSLDLVGGGDLILNNTGALRLNAASSAGALTLNTLNADLLLAANTQVAGGLNLVAGGTGAVLLPEAGFSQSGALSIDAYDLKDADHAVQLAAPEASIRLRSAAARAWQTDFASLSLALTGLTPFSLHNASSLSLAALSSQGDAQIASAGDLTLLTDPAVAGSLSLASQGTLRLPASGLSQPGLLIIEAEDLQDTDRAVNLAALRAQIQLRNPTAALSFNSQIASLDLTSGGPFAISFADADDLSLGLLSTGGDLHLSSVGSLDFTAASLAIGGNLSLVASEQLLLGAAGLSLVNPPALMAPGQRAPGASGAGDISIAARSIDVAGGGPLRLSAHRADINLTGNQPLNLLGALDELALSSQAEGSLSISNERDLYLSSLHSPQASALNLAINGALRLPNSGLAASGRLAINALDLFDDDRSLSLSAPQLQVQLAAASGHNLWTLAVDELDVAIAGSADLTLSDSQGLILTDLNNDGKSLSLADGNLALSLASGDLSIRADLISQDASNDSRQAGRLDISLAAGSISSQGALSISAQQASAQPPGSFVLSMVLTDTSAADRSIRLGAGTQVVAMGGDILFDTRPQATAAAARRTYVQDAASPSAAAAQVSAYTNQSDPSTGRVTLNGAPLLPSEQQRIGSNRWLAIVADAEGGADYGGALEQTQDLSQVTKALEQANKSGFTVDEQFGKVFGDCDEFDPKTRHRCKVNSALKAFLSHWLVGGELPSKREQN